MIFRGYNSLTRQMRVKMCVWYLAIDSAGQWMFTHHMALFKCSSSTSDINYITVIVIYSQKGMSKRIEKHSGFDLLTLVILYAVVIHQISKAGLHTSS